MMDAAKSEARVTLSISCVVYDTPLPILTTTITSLFNALEVALQQKTRFSYKFYLINNQSKISDQLNGALAVAQQLMNDNVELISGHGNVGYGRGNNIAIYKSNSEYHLILNPDVDMDTQAIHASIEFLTQHTDAGLVTPLATNEKNELEYLAKRIPSMLVILLRGLNNPRLNSIFKPQLDNYIYRDKHPFHTPMEIELASGCFMFCRTDILKSVGGFSPEYFLYFEDFDLSRKISRLAKIFLAPQVRIIHLGGKAASKGAKHIKMFLRSYLRFRTGY